MKQYLNITVRLNGFPYTADALKYFRKSRCIIRTKNRRSVIVKTLGQGGFGITYKATTQSALAGNLGGMTVEVPIAIKEFFIKDFCVRNAESSYVSVPTTGSKEQTEKYRQKFVKEARNIATLSHPNIVQVLDVFEENGTVYYVMQYLDGGSLRDKVKANGHAAASAGLRHY